MISRSLLIGTIPATTLRMWTPGDAPQGEPTLKLDPVGLQVSGTGGCNRFTGNYTLDDDQVRFYDADGGLLERFETGDGGPS